MRLIANSISFGSVACIVLFGFALTPVFESKPTLLDGDTAKNLRKNVVRIQATFQSGRIVDGYGFIVGERNDELYIVTANHVVRNDVPGDEVKSIQLKFFDDQGQSYTAVLLDTHYEKPKDLAVLRVSKPKNISWEPKCLALENNNLTGLEVVFIGRVDIRDIWYVPSVAGRVNSEDADSILTIDIGSVRVGTSGAPLVTKTGITGMILTDQDASVATAVSISFIKRAFEEWHYPWTVQETSKTVSKWLPVESSAKNVHSFALSGANIFAGSYGGGVFRSIDMGHHWVLASGGLTNRKILSLAINGSNLFAAVDAYGTNGSGVFRSYNNGQTWTGAGLDNFIVQALAARGSIIFAGAYGSAFLSKDDGGTWTPINNGFKNRPYINALALSGNNTFAGLGDSVYRSDDNGQSWMPINAGLPNEDIHVLSTNGTTLFAGTAGGGIARSTDNGQNWWPVNSGLPLKIAVQSIVLKGNKIYAGTLGAGVFMSTNKAESWAPINDGLTDLKVNGLLLTDSALIAGTVDGGLFIYPVQD